MTIAYSPQDSVYLSEVKQFAKVAAVYHVVTWKEVDDFESDVLHNTEGIEGLKESSKDFIKKIENYMERLMKKAC